MHSAYRASVDFDQSPITGKPRLFTVREANALLVEVEPLVAQMRDAARTAAVAGEIVQAFARRIADSGGGRVWVKDPVRGLLDFPSDRNGEVVELCWLHGEPEVAHWHRIGAGFAGRQPLDEDVS